MPVRLTDAKIAKLRPKASRYVVPDGEVPGLYVRVMPSGTKSYQIVSRDPEGKQVWREVHLLSKDGGAGAAADPGINKLKEVRKIAREAIDRIKAGHDAFPPKAPK